MKKKNVLNLIRYHYENNNVAFKKESILIAKDFEANGDFELANFIYGFVAKNNIFTPQNIIQDLKMLEPMNTDTEAILVPEKIKQSILGIINASNKNLGVHKFLFEGAPGTGKTDSVRNIARILNRDLYVANFSTIIDSKLGQTSKNIAYLFQELNTLQFPQKSLVLFDEIDALALDRLNDKDLREMGRATSELLKGLDNLNNNILLIATTNLYKAFDKALARRFDYVVNFDQYTKEDLINIACELLSFYLNKFGNQHKNLRFFKKILNLAPELPNPGDLKNIIKIAIVFSPTTDSYDYMPIIYQKILGRDIPDIAVLKAEKFTLREIQCLTGISKSNASRLLKE